MIYVKVVKKRSGLEGSGLFLDQDIKKNQRVLEFTGEEIDWSTAESLGHQDHVVPVGADRYIDIHRPMLESCVNHSCDPSTGFSNDTTLIALRDMRQGEEITFDYSLVTVDGWSMQCNCGSQKCRKLISDYMDLPKDLKIHYKDVTPSWVKEVDRKGS